MTHTGGIGCTPDVGETLADARFVLRLCQVEPVGLLICCGSATGLREDEALLSARQRLSRLRCGHDRRCVSVRSLDIEKEAKRREVNHECLPFQV